MLYTDLQASCALYLYLCLLTTPSLTRVSALCLAVFSFQSNLMTTHVTWSFSVDFNGHLDGQCMSGLCMDSRLQGKIPYVLKQWDSRSKHPSIQKQNGFNQVTCRILMKVHNGPFELARMWGWALTIPVHPNSCCSCIQSFQASLAISSLLWRYHLSFDVHTVWLGDNDEAGGEQRFAAMLSCFHHNKMKNVRGQRQSLKNVLVLGTRTCQETLFSLPKNIQSLNISRFACVCT